MSSKEESASSPKEARTPEASAAAWAAVTAAVMIAQQVAGKATRDALFLTSLEATELPKTMIAAAALSMVAVLAMTRGLSRLGPARLVPIAFVISGSLFAAEWFVAEAFPVQTAIGVYLHMAVFGSIVISGFWSVVSERFDPHSAKRLMGRIAGGASFGGVVGGLFAERVAAVLDVRAMLVVLALMNVACAIGVVRIGSSKASPSPAVAGSELTGLRLIRDVPYLQNLALLALLTSLVAALLDYVLKAEAAASPALTGERLFSFFAFFYTATGIVSFLLQTVLARASLRTLGLGTTIGLHPLSVLVTSIIAALFPQIVAVAIARGVEFVLANSLFRSGYELLYTPLALERKRPTKTIIDVAVNRLGDAVGSGFILLILAFFPRSAAVESAILVATAVFALMGLFVARRLHRGYVSELAESLRSGSLRLEDADVLDATTQRTLSETAVALDREKLLEQIAALKGDAPAAVDDLLGTRVSMPALAAHDPLMERVAALLSGDQPRIESVLFAMPIDPRLATHVLPLLGRKETEKLALDGLRSIAPRVVGQLVDALLDPNQPFAVRRKIPRVLRVCEPGRATEGLLMGLDDPRFEVRYQCGQSLLAIAMRTPELTFPKERVFEVATREVKVGTKVWESQKLIESDPDEESPLLESVLKDRVDRSLEHVFTILGLALDRETLQLSLRAFSGDDATLRGTALEYLENVLPEAIRKGLFAYLGDRRGASKRPPRPKQVVVEELLRSMDAVRVDPSALKKGPAD